MKKSLIALAVLATSGAAMAQSSVTLYGQIDTYFGTIKQENTATTGQGKSLSQTVLNSGGNNGNRWGLRGSEDLGGGLSAIFQVESGYDHTTGAAQQGGLLFGRQAYAGFKGGFGTVMFGRQYNAFDNAQGLSSTGWDGTFAASQNAFRSVGAGGGVLGNNGAAAAGYTTRTNNTIKYDTPNMSGFAGSISYALGEDKTLVLNASNIVAFNVTYANGPLGVQFAHYNEDPNNTLVDKKFTRLGANYAFGPLVAKFQYGKADNVNFVDGADTTEWQLGADYNLSSAVQLTAGYAKSDDNAKLGDANRKALSIAGKYTLSKTVNFYAAYVTTKQTQAGLQDLKGTGLVVGFQKWF